MTFSLNSPTFSVGLTGIKVGKQSTLKVDTIPDQDIVGNPVSPLAGMSYAMQTGAVFLVKGPTGEYALCRYDERSTPANPLLIRVKG